jgi:hypothetical protein
MGSTRLQDAAGSVTIQTNAPTTNYTATLPNITCELAPRMQLMAAKTATGTFVDFTGIPSWVKKITVMFNGVSTNGTSVPLIRLGAGSIDIGTYNCVVSTLSPASAAATMSNGFGLAVTSTSAANIFYGQSILTLMGSNVWTMQGILAYPSVSQQFTAGSKTLSAILDRIRITTVNGTDTFDAGNINIMYEG